MPGAGKGLRGPGLPGEPPENSPGRSVASSALALREPGSLQTRRGPLNQCARCARRAASGSPETPPVPPAPRKCSYQISRAGPVSLAPRARGLGAPTATVSAPQPTAAARCIRLETGVQRAPRPAPRAPAGSRASRVRLGTRENSLVLLRHALPRPLALQGALHLAITPPSVCLVPAGKGEPHSHSARPVRTLCSVEPASRGGTGPVWFHSRAVPGGSDARRQEQSGGCGAQEGRLVFNGDRV